MKTAESNLLRSLTEYSKPQILSNFSDVTKLHLEISRLKENLREHEHTNDIIEASCAPRETMLCQATEFACLLGFSFKSFEDSNGRFVLKWDHADGVESNVVFRTSSFPDFTLESSFFAASCIAQKSCRFYRCCLGACERTLKDNLDSIEPGGILLSLGRYFGLLDQTASTLEDLEDISVHEIESAQLRLTLDPKRFCL